jgi:hypothetical protein
MAKYTPPSFWVEYVSTARKAYRIQRPVDPNADPMLAAIYDWFRKIDAATAKAVAEGYIYFHCSWSASRHRILLRFRHEDGPRFQRTLPVDSRFQRWNGPPLRHDVVEIKIAIQSMIVWERRVQPDPKAGWLPLPASDSSAGTTAS